jgi:hypothetical protein
MHTDCRLAVDCICVAKRQTNTERPGPITISSFVMVKDQVATAPPFRIRRPTMPEFLLTPLCLQQEASCCAKQILNQERYRPGPVIIRSFVMFTDQVATAPRSVFLDPRCQSSAYAPLSSARSELLRQTNTEPGAVPTGSSYNKVFCNGHGPGRYCSPFRIRRPTMSEFLPTQFCLPQEASRSAKQILNQER